MDHGHRQSFSVTKIMPLSSHICDHVDGGIRLSGFVHAGFIAGENVNFPYFVGPWMDYQCHSEMTSNWIHYQFRVHYDSIRPRPMRLS